jgi:hypothetical protein
LCYPPSLVEQKLNELQSGPLRDEDRDKLLQICLYFIEKEFNFTSDGLFTGSGSLIFSEKLKSEVDNYRKAAAGANKNADVEVEPTRYSAPIYNTNTFGSAPSRTPLQATSRLFSSHSASDHYLQKRPIFTGFKGIVLQNPMKWIKIWAEMVNLQKEWDPAFDRKEFLLGTKHVGKCVCIAKKC